ncbi:MAG: TrmH family RNA methyltransferase [Faecousia sp.]
MSPERITSKTNPYIRHVKKLLASRSYRYAQRQYVADGLKLLQEAVKWQAPIRAVLVQDGVDCPLPEDCTIVRVPESLMREVSRMEAPQGVLTVCDMPDAGLEQIAPGCLILDGIQDPGNLGTMLRTADALGVQVVLSDGCADPYNEKTVRAAMGATFRMTVRQAERQAILDACEKNSVPLCVTALSQQAKDIRSLDLKHYATVIGSEGHGVCPQFLQAAQAEAIIPMSLHCESLNAAVAAAIVMWQMTR